MEMICLKNTIMKNVNGENIEIEVIRYFTNNDIEYLIYSLNEIDASGYTKLYASRIIGNNASIITDDEEWTLIKEIIKQIVKNNRDGSPLEIIDLNEKRLDDVVLVDTRVFRLQGNLVNLLSENKNVKEEFVDEEPEIEEPKIEEPEFETLEEDPIDYETLYNNLLIENENLKEQLKNAQELQEKIDKIKEIL
ncbi:MAG: DUF1292 domain-containing protein [Firmicutes bacterium]|nr:DUF1292 domain-containing protein [Bacillota bacterium]